MESSLQDDSKTSSEDSDKQDQVNDDAGSGRTYECVFCKRGFTTAQALGGHMNIHRKDRARNKQSVPSISKQPSRSGFLQPSSSQSQLHSSNMEANMSYQIYFPPSTSSMGHPYGYNTDDLSSRKPQPLSLFNDDWRASLSLQIGPTLLEDKEEKKENEEEDELDLELRLGHDP